MNEITANHFSEVVVNNENEVIMHECELDYFIQIQYYVDYRGHDDDTWKLTQRATYILGQLQKFQYESTSKVICINQYIVSIFFANVVLWMQI